MIVETIAVLDTSACTNCDGKIHLSQGDASLLPVWIHDVNGKHTCPGAPVAYPVENTDRPAWMSGPWHPAAVTVEFPVHIWALGATHRRRVVDSLRHKAMTAWLARHGTDPHGRLHVHAVWWKPEDPNRQVVILLGRYLPESVDPE